MFWLWRLLSTLIICGITSFSLAQITIEALTTYLNANSGQTLNLVVAFENRSITDDVEITPTLQLPTNWRSLIPLGQVTIAANNRVVIPFTLLVPKSATAGSHDVIVTVEGATSEALFTIDVAAITELSVTIEGIPERIISEAYEFNAVLTNLGNQTLDLDISANDNLEFPIAVTQQQLVLEPQQQEKITVQVTPPESLDQQLTQRITIEARNSKTLELLDSESKSVTLIPAQVSKLAAWHLFPVDLEISSGRYNFQDTDRALENATITLSGRGKLTDFDDGFLNFSVSTDAILKKRQFQIQYIKPTFGIAISNTNTSFSDTSLRNNGGLQTSAYYNFMLQENISATPYLYASLEDGISFGLRLNSIKDTIHSFNATFEGYLPYDDNFSFIMRASYRNQNNDFRTRIDAEYLGELNNSSEVVSQININGRGDSNSQFFTAGFKNVQEGFRNSSVTISNLDFTYTLRNRDLQTLIRGYALTEWRSSQTQEDISSRNTFGISANYTVDALNWRLDTEYNTFSANINNDNWKTSLQLFQYFNQSSYIQQRLSFINILNDETKNKLSYDVAMFHPIDNFTIRPSIKFEWNTYDFSLFNIESSLEAFLPTSFGSTLFSVNYDPFKDAYLALDTKVVVELNKQNKLTLAAGTTLSKTNELEFYVSSSYSHKIDVPVSRKTKVANAQGVLHDSKGNGLADILVEVSGQFAQTNEEGRFEIVNIPTGETYFKIVEGQLPAGTRTIPESPYFFKAEAGESIDFDFNVISSASVNINARFEEISATENTIVNKIDSSNLLNRLVVTLNSDSGKVRTIRSNANGFGSVFGLLPDTWTVTASLDDNDIEIILEKSQLMLFEGDEQSIEIILRPKARKVNFIDGGTITLELNPDTNDGN